MYDLLKNKYWIFQKRSGTSYWTSIALQSGDKIARWGGTFNPDGTFDFFEGVGFKTEEVAWKIENDVLHFLSADGEIVRTVEKIEITDRESHLWFNEMERFQAYNFFDVTVSNEMRISVNAPNVMLREKDQVNTKWFYCGSQTVVDPKKLPNVIFENYTDQTDSSYEHFVITKAVNQPNIKNITVIVETVNDLMELMGNINEATCDGINVITQNGKFIGISGKKDFVVKLIMEINILNDQLQKVTKDNIEGLLKNLKIPFDMMSV
ncbi:hypothetical protein H9L19_00440 [Weissella diestrammenae]|uniref:Uncharacterized protein n=2 Tax=Weissella diestrammenae TaxID=1162633 RepID=A0A7G9T5N5_9LACO|nr:hypothetical protein [Weissella diestrammenae]QNN75410.1 hypothetical protein H9L19_00440 [Weissella diestrammenae]